MCRAAPKNAAVRRGPAGHGDCRARRFGAGARSLRSRAPRRFWTDRGRRLTTRTRWARRRSDRAALEVPPSEAPPAARHRPPPLPATALTTHRHARAGRDEAGSVRTPKARSSLPSSRKDEVAKRLKITATEIGKLQRPLPPYADHALGFGTSTPPPLPVTATPAPSTRSQPARSRSFPHCARRNSLIQRASSRLIHAMNRTRAPHPVAPRGPVTRTGRTSLQKGRRAATPALVAARRATPPEDSAGHPEEESAPLPCGAGPRAGSAPDELRELVAGIVGFGMAVALVAVLSTRSAASSPADSGETRSAARAGGVISPPAPAAAAAARRVEPRSSRRPSVEERLRNRQQPAAAPRRKSRKARRRNPSRALRDARSGRARKRRGSRYLHPTPSGRAGAYGQAADGIIPLD